MRYSRTPRAAGPTPSPFKPQIVVLEGDRLTETLVICGLAAGIPIREVFARELVTGAITGTLIGVVFFPFALVVWDDAAVAGSVALALGVSCSIATVVAMALPYALARSGRDPAYGSGPLATVIQDLLSVIVYFAIATALV